MFYFLFLRVIIVVNVCKIVNQWSFFPQALGIYDDSIFSIFFHPCPQTTTQAFLSFFKSEFLYNSSFTIILSECNFSVKGKFIEDTPYYFLVLSSFFLFFASVCAGLGGELFKSARMKERKKDCQFHRSVG